MSFSEQPELPNIRKPKETYIFEYPQAEIFTKKQMEVFWLPDEIKVEKDLQDLKVNMTESESHGVLTVLKLFTQYELLIGNEIWGGRIKESFPHPEIEMMATTFSFFELGVHAPFYSKILDVLGLKTEEFFNAYKNDDVLSSRINFVHNAIEGKDLALSVAVFSMLEGAVLYSSFAFLAHFQNEGKNKIVNICRGINFSQRDEDLHAKAAAWLFNTFVAESNLSPADKVELDNQIIAAAKEVYEHESRIVEMIFEKGKIEGINEEDLRTFVKSRINLCLRNMGLKDLFIVKENPIGDWFYKKLATIQFHDFFTGVGSEYSRKNSQPESYDW